MSRRASINKRKRYLGGAVKRTKVSYAAEKIYDLLAHGDPVLDFGCGHGFDAEWFGWSSYDPFYRPCVPEEDVEWPNIVCINVLNTLSLDLRHEAIAQIQEWLSESGIAYLAVPRDLPTKGKLGMHHSLQNYVVLTLPLVFEDKKLAIYKLKKDSKFKDHTTEYMTPRDRRILRS